MHHVLSIFRTEETTTIDAANISLLITRIIDYIKHNLADKKPPAGEFTDVVRAFWSLIASLYSSRWDLLPIEDKNIHILMGEKILPGYLKCVLLKKNMIEKSLSSSSSISLLLNMAVSSPCLTATSVVVPPLPTSVAP